jgi:predicted DNA-binding ribbon-helix-helix protein
MAATSTRTFVISGKLTRVELEHEFWDALEEIGERESVSVSDLLTREHERNPQRTVASSLRVFITLYFRALAETAPAMTPWRIH